MPEVDYGIGIVVVLYREAFVLYNVEEFRNVRFNVRARSGKRTESEVGDDVGYILITVLLNTYLYYRGLIIKLDNYVCSYMLRALLLVLVCNYLEYDLGDVLVECI